MYQEEVGEIRIKVVTMASNPTEEELEQHCDVATEMLGEIQALVEALYKLGGQYHRSGYEIKINWR